LTTFKELCLDGALAGIFGDAGKLSSRADVTVNSNLPLSDLFGCNKFSGRFDDKTLLVILVRLVGSLELSSILVSSKSLLIS
jgi:hypothetical protein